MNSWASGWIIAAISKLQDVVVQRVQRRAVDRLVVCDSVAEHSDVVEFGADVFPAPVAAVREGMLEARLPERGLVVVQTITSDPRARQANPHSPNDVAATTWSLVGSGVPRLTRVVIAESMAPCSLRHRCT